MRTNELLATLAVLSKQYSVSFQVLPTKFLDDWPNVIHLTIEGNNNKYGYRIPAIFFGKTGSIWFSKAVYRNGNDYFLSKIFKLGAWITVNIIQFKSGSDYRYQIFLNGEKVHEEINKDIREFKDVKIYAGDPWYPAQPGIIRNFVVTNIKGTYIYFHY